MVIRVNTIALSGVKARDVDVQVQISAGLPAFTIVGLGDKAIGESRERVRGAISACGLALPPKRITVNLAPADMPKVGSHYDLPIAMGIMAAIGVLPKEMLEKTLVLGELELDGSLRAVSGILPAAIHAVAQDKTLICPEASGREAVIASETLKVIAPRSLVSLVNHAKGTQTLPRPRPVAIARQSEVGDFNEIRGQESAKRALEVAAAGGHNLLFVGPPGAGKSMLASRLPSILPPMTAMERLELSIVESVAGLIHDRGLSARRPFRSPHHSTSMAAMVGGGAQAQPGEVALAHNGVLFLDELPEFAPQVLDSLRQPLETGEVFVARVNYRVTYPARFQLVTAMNPCRCGRAAEPGKTCARGDRCAADYQARLSAPFLDRIDIFLGIPAVQAKDLALPPSREGSEQIAARVAACREKQQKRYEALGQKGVHTNSQCPPALLEDIVGLSSQQVTLLTKAAETYGLSARGYHRVMRLARTIADLDGTETVAEPHLAEALGYRSNHQDALGHLNI